MSTSRWVVAVVLAVAAVAVPQAAHAQGVARPNTPLPPEETSLAGKFVPVTPKRLMDTRDGAGLPSARPVDANTPAVLDIRGITGDPAVTADAVVLNVTVTNATADSFVSVSADPKNAPAGSNVNFAAGQTVPNLVTVGTGGGQFLTFYDNAGSADVIADVFGYYTHDAPADALSTMSPTRLLDTRDGGRPVGPGGILALQVAGVGGVPASGVTAVQLNVTATNPTGNSFLSVYPSGTPRPAASNLNYRPGQTVANSALVPVGPDGKIDFYNNLGLVDVVADISGYYTAGHGSSLDTWASTRVLDTRQAGGKIGPGQSRTLDVAAQIPNKDGAPSAVVLNVTATNPTATSFLTVYPHGMPAPNASNLNFTPWTTRADLVVAPVSADGKVDIYNNLGDVDVVVDLCGWYRPDTGLGVAAASFSPSTVDATNGASVDVNWTVTDADPDNQNVFGVVVLRMAGRQPGAYVGQSYTAGFGYTGHSCCDDGVLTGGTPQNSSYRYTFKVPPRSDTTTAHWVVAGLIVTDSAGHVLIAAGGDLDALHPVLTAATRADQAFPGYTKLAYEGGGAMDHFPFHYDASAGYAVYHVDTEDQDSGVWKGSLTLTGPGGRTLTGTFQHDQVNGALTHPYDCVYDIHSMECPIRILVPKGTPTGLWAVSSLVLTDNAGNSATYDANLPPLGISDDSGPLSASNFDISPRQADNWRHAADITVSMRVNGARQGVKAIYVESYLRGEHCPATSTTPAVRPDGGYAITITLSTAIARCTISGIAVVDGAGDVALYGFDYGAPDPNLVASKIPDTTPPVITGVSISPSSGRLPTAVLVDAVGRVQMAPIFQCETFLYDSTGKPVADVYSDFTEGPNGTLEFPVSLPALPAGVYRVGFRFFDAGFLQTEYGTPNGNPMPGGPLTFTAT